MFINKGEIAPINISEGKIIMQVKVDKIENLNPEYRHLTYGIIEQKTIINCKPAKEVSQTLKILSDKVQEK